MSLIKTFEEDTPAIPTNIKRRERDDVSRQIDEFIARGHKIEVIATGYSGHKDKPVWRRADDFDIRQAARQ